MKLEFFVATKYLFSPKKTFTFISSIVSISNVTISIAALIVTLGVIDGFHNEIKRRILGLSPHIILAGNLEESFVEKKLSEIKQIEHFSPFIYHQVILKSKSGMKGCVLKGIRYERESKVTDLGKKITKGSFADFKDGIVLGSEITKELNLEIGDKLVLVLPEDLFSIPKMKETKLTGIFNAGIYDYDSNLGFMELEAAEDFFEAGGLFYGIKLRKIDDVDKTVKLLTTAFPFCRILSWKDLNQNLFFALKLEKLAMSIILLIIIVIACFSVISSLILLVSEKTKDIGILSAIGLESKRIKKIFIYTGVLIGSIGITIGVVLGSFICFIISKYQFIKLPKEVYFIDKLPIEISILDILVIGCVSAILIVLSTLYPANKASRLKPMEIMRHG